MHKNIRIATQALRNDELVIAPTDTLYALTANAKSDAAVQKIFMAKKRYVDMALPVMVRDFEHASEFAVISPIAKELVLQYWPGALTIVVKLKQHHGISRYVIGADDTIALRAPNSVIFQELLRLTGLPLIGTSANISGTEYNPDFTYIKNIFTEFTKVAIEEGSQLMGLPSTIIDCSTDTIKVLRQGLIKIF